MKAKTSGNAGNSVRLTLLLAGSVAANSHGQDNFAQFELSEKRTGLLLYLKI